MTYICFYFQVHQPERLRKYSYFDIGVNHDYFDENKNREILQKVAQKCYLPTNELLLKIIKNHVGDFKISFSISGSVIDQFKKQSPETLDSFKRLADTGCVEFLNETYFHSLSFLFSPAEFHEQVMLHRDLIKREFGVTATTFRNTELIYSNDLAKAVTALGYKTILAEGADKILAWRSPNFLYQTQHGNAGLLLRNYRLADDIAFRFSNRGWKEYPLFANKYAQWLHALYGEAEVVNLFMDYETFGEHQWQETGIFDFMHHLPHEVLKHPHFIFSTPSEVGVNLKPVASLDVPNFISWADEERDLTAWCGNDMQKDALQAVYSFEHAVKASGNAELLHIWRKLLTSDHFYYMCTKFDQDGDVHKYFNPYSNPYDAYLNFQNVLSDFAQVLLNKN